MASSETEEERQQRIDAIIARGNAPIKAEFIIPRPPRPSTADADASRRDDPAACTEQAADGKQTTLPQKRSAEDKGSRKRVRGQNKNKERRENRRLHQENREEQMCGRVAGMGECAFGDKCRFKHDLAAFMEVRPPDLGGDCPVFDKFGMCMAGANCRFGGKHIDAQGRNLTKDGEMVTPAMMDGHLKSCGVTNQLTDDIKHRLRKQRHSYPRSQAFVQTWEAYRTSLQEAKQTSSPLPDPPSAPLPPDPSIGAAIVSTWEDRRREGRSLDLRGKLVLAPLTTVGNLPFRRLCRRLGADVTVGEMALADSLLQGKPSEWALLKRHEEEKCFGVQVASGWPDVMTRCAEMLDEHVSCDFVDINMGCPLDQVHRWGAGTVLSTKPQRLEGIVRGMSSILACPLTIKMRNAHNEPSYTAHNLMPKLEEWGVSAICLHARTAKQRYTKKADWDYMQVCKQTLKKVPLIGCGDIMNWEEAEDHLLHSGADSLMVARGALIKPWIFTEIREKRHWDISASERLDILRDYAKFGMENWGSDPKGVATTRRFMLEWLSFLSRYIPVGLLERVPCHINLRPDPFVGRNDLETKMASTNVKDWIEISEMLLGPVPKDFTFMPKHKSSGYANASTNGVSTGSGPASTTTADAAADGADGAGGSDELRGGDWG
ncbi:unnamed protein product [Vitrella brassicaformis CCMP3155]|uniref:tRNA-dihydrouridine(47) synthase [NAD(P)(+)] n=2 Tax=Vitrella brassicaformis TaxID=1169539 RepID=A0A0G4GH78_VITBC|nr:unnamed protein product [Vitrella brassicaformis CCMP3155]|eukprot:CEM29095.1 unnamed protein product [Vitrella brassicaformis CCMP3155]